MIPFQTGSPLSEKKSVESARRLLLDGWQKFGRIQSNRPVSWINCRVNSRIFLLTSSGKSLLPYINSCVETLLEGLVSPNGRTDARTPARRSRRLVSKDGQSNKNCSISSIPSFERQIGFIVSLKIVLEFVKVQFAKTNPNLCKIR